MTASTVVFSLPGPLKGKARPRFSPTDHRARTPRATKAQERSIASYAKIAMVGRPLFQGPVKLLVWISQKPPASWNKEKRLSAINGEIVPTGKPDLSNVLKSIEDALNGVVYRDDSQVSHIEIGRRYAPIDTAFVEVHSL